MPKYRVKVYEENWGWVEVEAEDEDDAQEQVEDSMRGLNSYRFWSGCRDQDGNVDLDIEVVME
jgi:hypothetical protein